LCFMQGLQFARSQTQPCGCTPQQQFDASDPEPYMKLENGLMVTRIEGDIDVIHSSEQSFKNAINVIPQQWVNGVLYYSLLNVPDQASKTMIDSALSNASSMVGNRQDGTPCITFNNIDNTGAVPPRKFVSVLSPTQSSGCSSPAGLQRYMGNNQSLNLASGCYNQHTIVHEFMHALGFNHEQSRPDRDYFLTVNWTNVASASCTNFNKCMTCKIVTYYDFLSIMQYNGDYFNCGYTNNPSTMLYVGNGTQVSVPKGWMSPSDVAEIQLLYGCKCLSDFGPSIINSTLVPNFIAPLV